MTASRIEGDVFVVGNLRTVTLTIPAGTIMNVDVGAGAAIAATKLEHQHAIPYWQADGSDVVSAIVPVHIVRGTTATIIAFEVACLDSPSGGDKKFTADLLQTAAGDTTPTSVLSAAVDYVNGTADCAILGGTISSASLADGDQLTVQIAVSGSTGTQGQGLIVTTTIREDA